MHMKKIIPCVLLLVSLLSGCGTQASKTSDFFAMDTFMSLTVWDGSEARAQAALSSAEQRINELSNCLSRQVSSSSLAQLNAAGGEAVTLDEDTYEALSKALEYAELTDGRVRPHDRAAVRPLGHRHRGSRGARMRTRSPKRSPMSAIRISSCLKTIRPG